MATTGEILRTIRRKKALGQTVSDRFVRNLFAAELDVERGRALEGERLGLARTEAESLQKFREGSLAEAAKTREAETRAATIRGGVELGTLAFGTEGGRKFVGGGLRRAGEGIIRAAGGEVVPTTGAFAAGAETGAGAFAPGTLAPTVGTQAGVPLAVTGAEGAGTLSSGAGAITETGVVGTEAGVDIGGQIRAVGTGAGAGAVSGTIAQRITRAGEPGHEGGERETGRVLGAAGGIGLALALSTGPIGLAIAGLVGAFTGGGDETVICTELHKQGYMPKEMLDLEYDFKKAHVDAQVYAGYRIIADPIVNLMQKSWLFTQLVRAFAMPWAYQMCHMVAPDKYKPNLIGKAVMAIGIPLCRWKGELTREAV